jgi:L-seryl-tRNA(Ser) seleniumtransferase
MKDSGNTLRALPSVDALNRSEAGRQIADEVGAERVTALSRSVIESMREEVSGGAELAGNNLIEEAGKRLKLEWQRTLRRKQQRVINATGVVIHTNLARAPLSRAAVDALAEFAGGYCNIEYDLETGHRGSRGVYCEDLICELTGAEGAIIVNNCAAAAFLVLKEIASGGEVVISRGELVEIGGDFRVPDVLTESGATLREVGTTNRTKLSDYERAINENTRLILRVHPSNYRVVGFTSAPELSDLTRLAHDRNIPLYEDAGSGALIDPQRIGLTGEPLISESLTAGADVVTFSGDKLLGGPQCGIITGRRELIARLRRNPLFRALRVDKLIYAALQATLESYARGDAEAQIPVLSMLASTPEAIRKRANRLVAKLRKGIGPHIEIEIVDGESAVGGGAAPTAHPRTSLISIRDERAPAESVAEQLRMSDVPVVARVADDRLLLDLRTVFEHEEKLLLNTLTGVLNRDSNRSAAKNQT